MVPCDDLRFALAIYGFKVPETYRPEQAGVHFEARRVRERLLLGQDCSYVLSSSWSKIFKSYSKNGLFYSLSSSNKNSNGNFQQQQQQFDENGHPVEFSSNNNNNDNNNNNNNNNNRFSSSSDEDENNNSSSNEEDVCLEFDKEDKAYEKFLKNLNPTQYKEQDHYKVLGLSKLRYKASEKQIKLAYKKKVLSHHPDKRRQKGQDVKSTEEDYFTCISKAYEFLSNQQKRRAYDSVDPLFDDTIPSGTLTYKENFFKLYVPAFERNERWSTVQPCPKLGDINSTEEQVNKFYNFWYNLDSWREFSYLDEEDKEKGENRLERRWIDKQNKAARDKRRKDELKRLRTLVDSAYKNDPRVQKFKEDEKKRKENERFAREEERRVKQEAEEKERRQLAEKEEQEKARLEEEAKQKVLNEKREKELLKKALQKERKALKELCQKYNYFCHDPKNNESELLRHAGELDKICQLFPLEKLKSMNEALRPVENGGGGKLSNELLEKYASILGRFLRELDEMLDTERKLNFNASMAQNREEDLSVAADWSTEENQLLIKAMTIFPVGTKSRWDVIASFINEHLKTDSSNINGETAPLIKKKTGKDVVAKVKQIQKLDEKSKESVSKGMPLLQVKSNVQVETAPSVRTDSAQTGWESNPWTSQEQKLLEQALKTYHANDAERWDKVAACLPGRTKKDCIKRYKELAEIVRARKVALQHQQQKEKSNSSGGGSNNIGT